MNYLSQQVSEGNTYDGKHFALGNDLTYDRSIENNFEPIGVLEYMTSVRKLREFIMHNSL